MSLTTGLVNVDNRSAVVEITARLGGDLEGGGVSLRNDSVVFLKAAGECVGEVIVTVCIPCIRSMWVRNTTLHSAGENRDAACLDHGYSCQGDGSGGSELHIGNWYSLVRTEHLIN